MNCYTLQSNSSIPQIDPQYTIFSQLPVFISPTLHHYTDKVQEQIKSLEQIYTKPYINQICDIFDPVLCQKTSGPNLFCYEIIEIIRVHLHHYGRPSSSSTIIGFSKTPIEVTIAANLAFAKTDVSIASSVNFRNILNNYIDCTHTALMHSVDCFIFETDDDSTQYVHWLLLYLLIVLKYQMNGGNCIIKLNNVRTKPIVEIIYLFTKFYNHVVMVRPSITPSFSNYSYLVCTGYTGSFDALYTNINTVLHTHLENSPPNGCISSLFSVDTYMPIHFITKIDEINVVFSHFYFAVFEQVLAFMSNNGNNNKHKSLENIRQSHLDKYYAWRQTYNLCEIFDLAVSQPGVIAP